MCHDRKKLWIIIRREKDGMKVTLAGLSNRNPLNFKREFKEILTSFENDMQRLKQGDKL